MLDIHFAKDRWMPGFSEKSEVFAQSESYAQAGPENYLRDIG